MTVEDLDAGMKHGAGWPMGPCDAARPRRHRRARACERGALREDARAADGAAAAARRDAQRGAARPQERPRLLPVRRLGRDAERAPRAAPRRRRRRGCGRGVLLEHRVEHERVHRRGRRRARGCVATRSARRRRRAARRRAHRAVSQGFCSRHVGSRSARIGRFLRLTAPRAAPRGSRAACDTGAVVAVEAKLIAPASKTFAPLGGLVVRHLRRLARAEQVRDPRQHDRPRRRARPDASISIP